MTTVITGANRGIGAALYKQLSAKGGAVLGTARHGVDGLWPLDVTQPDSIAALAQHLDGTPVETLICNSGVYLDKREGLADGFGPQLWADTFAVNVTGVFLTVQALLPHLQMAEGAKIAILSSQMGSSARAGGSAYIYRASKAAALNLGRNLAVDLEGLGIAVGVYHPGWVRTDMGGSAAAVSPEDSAAGLIARFEALSLGSTGCFENYDGTAMPF